MTLSVPLRIGLAAATLIISVSSMGGPIPLSDGRDGMSCYYYASGMRMEWQKPGGDWLDASGTAYGTKAYSTERIGRSRQAQTVSWDVTELVNQWSAGIRPAGAFFLRVTNSEHSGIVNFASREDSAGRAPTLVLQWEDGNSERIGAAGDVHFSCPNHGSKGSSAVLQIGGRYNAILIFPFENPRGRRVARATLEMTSDKQYGGGAEIGVYSLLLPWSHGDGARQGIASRFENDREIDKDPDVYFADDFESGDWRSKWSRHSSNSHPQTVRSSRDQGFESIDGKALKVTIEKGKRLGLGMHYRFADHPHGEPEEAFFRYYLRFGEGWNPTIGGKLPGFSGTYGRAGWGGRKSDGENGWSARGSYYAQSKRTPALSHLIGIGSYVAHVDMHNEYGDSWGWNLGPTGALEKNRWYAVEQQVRLNTPGETDGILRAWIDGRLVFEKRDVRFRNVPALKIESVWMDVYHGGTARAKSDLTLFIDNVVVARKYIGPLVRR